MKGQANNLDFNVDFTAGHEGQLLTIEDFLEDTVVEKGEKVDEVEDDIVIDEKDDGNENEEDIKLEEVEGQGNESDEVEEDGEGIKNKPSEQPSYKKMLDTLISKKLIDPIDAFELDDGTEIPYKDKDITEEEFLQIIDSRLEEERQKASQNKVSTEGVSDFTKKLIEIEKNGGSVKHALESYQTYKAPLDGLDMDNEDDQKAVLYMRYHAQGLEDAEIQSLIKGFESNGKLESRAIAAKENLEQAFQKQMDALNQQAIERDKERKEALKEYRGELNEELSSFGLKDSVRRKLVDAATRENEQGTYELDEKYYEIRQDPKQASELAMFLLNKDDYIKKITEGIKRDEAINTMKKFKLVKKGSSSIKLDTEDDDSNDKYMINLEDIIK